MLKEKIRILYLDDELNNLSSFKATFREYYNVYTAENPNEARKILFNQKIHIVIADQRMPEETGVSFLQSILGKYNSPVRILMTGYTDLTPAIDAINKGQVFRYITKPWNEKELRTIIEEAYQVYSIREEKDKELNSFFYKASHDIKGPLSSLAGLVQLAKEDINNKNLIKQYVQLIGDSINRLLNTIDDLLEFKRIDHRTLNYSSIHFGDLISDVLSSLEYLENFRKIKFDINIQQLNDFVNDKAILRSIFQNLIHNSIKYGAYTNNNANVSITITSNDKKATMEIKDNGQGIGETVMDNIFNMFYKGNESSEGSGLGLYIVKTGVEKIGGKVEVQSKQGEGSTFTVIIPNIDLSMIRKKPASPFILA
jgi:two-component system sensor histidine kinase/response regulator